MKMPVLAMALAVAVGGGAAAGDTDRFALEKTADGYVRMDKSSGAMSLCREEQGQLVCKAASDHRPASSDDVTALTQRVESLEKQVAALQAGKQGEAGLPSDEEFEKAMGFMERFFKRFMDMVRSFESEEAGAPQKT